MNVGFSVSFSTLYAVSNCQGFCDSTPITLVLTIKIFHLSVDYTATSLCF